MDSMNYFPSFSENYYTLIQTSPYYGCSYSEIQVITEMSKTGSFSHIIPQLSNLIDSNISLDVQTILVNASAHAFDFDLSYTSLIRNVFILYALIPMYLPILIEYFGSSHRRAFILSSFEKFLLV